MEVVTKEYKTSLDDWTKGTGGGPGAPENYENWKEWDGSFFSGYAKKMGSGGYLTWIYMRDKDLSFPLCSKFKGLPDDACLEQGTPCFFEKVEQQWCNLCMAFWQCNRNYRLL